MPDHNPLDIEIQTLDAQIEKLTNQRNTLAEIRVSRYGPLLDGGTHRVLEVPKLKTIATAKPTVGLKSKKQRPMSALIMSGLRKVGEKGASRSTLRGYASMQRDEVKAKSFSHILYDMKAKGKTVLIDGKYYLKSKAPKVSSAT